MRLPAQVVSPPNQANAPTQEQLATTSFWRKFIFTGGTSIVLPLNDFKRNLDPAFSAATGADFVVNSRTFIGTTFSYNRHGYTSNTLYPGINLESNTELLSLFFNGRFLLGPTQHRFNPYLFAGPGVSIVSTPAITREGGAGRDLLVTKTSETKLMGNVGAGFDLKINPMLILYVESSYNTSFSGSRVEFAPVLLGFRTYPADFFKKQ